MQETEFLLLLLTPASVASKWVRQEWVAKLKEEYKTGGVAILPVMAQQCRMLDLLQHKRYVDLQPDFMRGVIEIARAVTTHRERKQTGETSTLGVSLEAQGASQTQSPSGQTLRLLAGKRATQGAHAIRTLQSRLAHGTQAVDDRWLQTLYQYIFDDVFLERLGQEGVDLLQIIADEDTVDEADLFAISGMEHDEFLRVLDELFRACSVFREEIATGMVSLNMHPLTRAYFRTPILE